TARLAHKMLQHRARPLEVGHDAVNQRSYDRDVARLAPVHLQRFLADGNYFTRSVVDCNQRRLIDDEPTTTHGDHRRRGSQVDGDRIRDQISQSGHSHERRSLTYESHTSGIIRFPERIAKQGSADVNNALLTAVRES